MTPDTAAQDQEALPTTERELIDDMYRRIVRIHAAIAERTNQEVGEMAGWTLHELMEVIREIGAFRRERRKTSDAAS